MNFEVANSSFIFNFVWQGIDTKRQFRWNKHHVLSIKEFQTWQQNITENSFEPENILYEDFIQK